MLNFLFSYEINVSVPQFLVIATDVYDRFLKVNNLREKVLKVGSNEEIDNIFRSAVFPGNFADQLHAYLSHHNGPLAVRSSSLLEDSLFQPFAGVYSTYMLPNNAPSLDTRVFNLLEALKLVYASSFHREAIAYLKSRGLSSPEMMETFRLGFSNRTLGYRLPDKNRKAGAKIRGRLQTLGIFRKSGHEHFTGSLVTPVIDEQGEVLEVYGRKIHKNLPRGTPLHLYLPGPHRGVWNETALSVHEEVILCESLIDALTFWSAGYRNVTASYGIGGFTPDHLEAFQRHETKRVLIAYDRDDPLRKYSVFFRLRWVVPFAVKVGLPD